MPGRLWLVVALEGEVVVETIKGRGGEAKWVYRLERDGAVGGDEQCGVGIEWGHMTDAMVECAESHC